MNDGLMDDDAFDDMVNAEARTIEDDPFGFEPFIGERPWEYGDPPGWRQLSQPASYLAVRLPRPTSDGWVTMRMEPHRVHLALDGCEQASTLHTPAVGDIVSLSSFPILDGIHYEVVVQKPDSDERRIILTWNKYHDAPSALVARRPWWRRWLDRAWPARARS